MEQQGLRMFMITNIYVSSLSIVYILSFAYSMDKNQSTNLKALM